MELTDEGWKTVRHAMDYVMRVMPGVLRAASVYLDSPEDAISEAVVKIAKRPSVIKTANAGEIIKVRITIEQEIRKALATARNREMTSLEDNPEAIDITTTQYDEEPLQILNGTWNFPELQSYILLADEDDISIPREFLSAMPYFREAWYGISSNLRARLFIWAEEKGTRLPPSSSGSDAASAHARVGLLSLSRALTRAKSGY